MILELLNQFLDCFLADVIVFLDSRMEQSLDPEVFFAATTFVIRSTVTVLVVLAGMIEGRSRVGACGVLAFIIQVRLQYKSLRCNKRLIRFAVDSSPDFLTTTFSIHIASKVL